MRLIQRYLCFLCLALLPASVFADGSIFDHPYNWRHPDQVSITDGELIFTDQRAKHFKNESLYFTGLLDNGWVFTLGFFGWTQGVLRGYGAYASVAEADGRHHWIPVQLNRNALTFGQDHLLIRSESIHFEGVQGHYRVQIEQQDFACDLNFDALLPAWKPGDGVANITDDPSIVTRLTVVSPWSEVQGTLRIDDRSWQVHGQAYGDLIYMVQPAHRLNAPVYGFKTFSSPETAVVDRWFLSVIEYVAHESYGGAKIPILLLARANRWVLTSPRVELTPLSFRAAPGIDQPYPTRYRVQVEDQGVSIQGEYQVLSLYDITDMLADFSPLIRSVIHLFVGGSLNFRGLGRFQGSVTLPDGSTERLLLFGPSEYLTAR